MLPATTVIVPGCDVVTLPCETVTVIPVSDCAEPSDTFAVPLVILGDRVTVPPAATMVVSGLRSHEDAGAFAVVPVMTSNVAVYGANV